MISLGIQHCFATGKLGVPKSSFIRLGVSQILSRLTNASYMSHLLRVLIPIGKEAKNTKVRQIHCSSIGYYCPMESVLSDKITFGRTDRRSGIFVMHFSIRTR